MASTTTSNILVSSCWFALSLGLACGDDDPMGSPSTGDDSDGGSASAGDDTVGDSDSGETETDGDASRMRAAPEALAAQGDHLIVVGAAEGDLFVARFDRAGELDPTFGTDGTVRLDLGGSGGVGGFTMNDDGATAVHVGEDSIIVGGYGHAIAGTTAGKFALAKFDADGAIDPTFGEGGIVLSDWGTEARIENVHVDAEGRIYAVGSLYNGATNGMDYATVRYASDGSVDASFSLLGEGAGAVWHASGDDRAVASALLDDGLLVGGGCPFTVGRFMLEGPLDASYGTAGSFTMDGGCMHALQVGSDGSTLLAGVVPNQDAEPATSRLRLVRLTEAGVPDPGFGEAGVHEITFDLTLLELPEGETLMGGLVDLRGLEVLPSGEIVLYGSVVGPLNNFPTIIRLQADGSPNETFAPQGLRLLDASLPLLDGLGGPVPPSRALVVDDTLFITDVSVDDGGAGLWLYSMPL